MNKAELIEAVAGRVGADKRAATNAVEAVIDTITRAVAAGEKVAISGFGVFERIERGARMMRNPATGEQIKKGKTSVPKFRAGSQFKDVVSGAKKLAKAAPAAAASTATKAAAKATGGAKKTASAKKAAPAKKSTAKKATPAKKSTAKKAAPAKKSSAKKAAPAKKTSAKKTAKR